MPLFHRPRLSSAIVFAFLFVSSSLASPLANAGRSRSSIIAASEPVYIIPSDEVPPRREFSKEGSTTTKDGITTPTTFNKRRTLAQRGGPLSIVSVSEPVNVIPTGELPPGQRLNSGSSRTTNDGTTVTTTYNIPRNIVERRVSPSIIAASEPVYVIPDNDDHGRRLAGSNSNATTSHTTDDGTTVTTTFNTGRGRNLLQANSSVQNSVSLINLKNQSLANSAVSKGINCEGSLVMCIGAPQWGVMHTLRDYMYAIPDGYHYYTGQDIACMKHHIYPHPVFTWGFYCAFMEGNIPAEGFDGAAIQLKMQQMIEHHCLGCGSVPFSPDNDPNTLGILTVNYVSESECEGLCYYKPPGTAVKAAVTVPKGMTLASS